MFDLDPQLIKEQFCEDHYHITKKIVRFADDQNALRISLNKDDAVAKGWSVSLVSEEEVCRQCYSQTLRSYVVTYANHV